MKKIFSEPNYKHHGRKVTKTMANQMAKMRAKGKTFTEIAIKYDVSPATVKYNIDPEFRKSELIRTGNRK